MCTSAARSTPISGCSVVAAVEHLRQDGGEEAQLADLTQRDDVEDGVVQLGVGSDEHAPAVGAVVGNRDPVAAELAALAVERERERGLPPADERAQRGVGVHEAALDPLRLVGDPVGVRVEAAARDAQEALAVDLADVDLAQPSGAEHLHGAVDVVRDAEHPGQVVPAPARNHAEARPRPGEHAADLPDEAVAAHHDRHLTRLPGRSRLTAAVLDALGEHAAKLDPASAQRALRCGEQLADTPAAGRGVDEQQMSIAGRHRASQPRCSRSACGRRTTSRRQSRRRRPR